ncbi:hypothetical protein ACFL0T_07495 [Candidatus Omnitrophota bacterium]
MDTKEVIMNVEHINITIPATLKNQLDSYLNKIKMKRSTFIQHAIMRYIKERKSRQLAQDLQQGYKLMSTENIESSDEWFALEDEIDKNE